MFVFIFTDGAITLDINEKRVLTWTDPFPIDIKYAMFTNSRERKNAVWYFNCLRSPHI